MELKRFYYIILSEYKKELWESNAYFETFKEAKKFLKDTNKGLLKKNWIKRVSVHYIVERELANLTR